MVDLRIANDIILLSLSKQENFEKITFHSMQNQNIYIFAKNMYLHIKHKILHMIIQKQK